MSDDLKLIEQLEKETGITLQRIYPEEIGEYDVTGFAMDNIGRVRGLAIWKAELFRLPELLSKFQSLENLALVDNQISDISSLKKLKRLTVLDLARNQISDISSLKELKELTSLHLYDNQISDISSLKELKGLTYLDLGGNQIWHISSLNELKGLTDLNLVENQIWDISSLKELKGLTYLYLGGNKISDISSLNKLKGLTTLFLDYNEISDISSLKELKGLTRIILSFNHINDISSLKELRNLKYLDLRYNEITHIPAGFLDLGLEIKWGQERNDEDGILLEGNPLESPTVEIIKKGNEAIRQYFKALEGEKQAFKQHPSDKMAKELVFISYSRKDEDFVLPLCKRLKEAGVEIWLDQWDIAPGDDWDISIDDAIYKCTRMLIILSPDAVDSYQVRGELHTFFKEKKPVIPIVYRDCRIPRILNVIQHTNFISSDLEDKTKIADLVKIITK